jgi:hypothetical protein
MRRKRGRNHHHTRHLKKVTMLALSHAILGMSIRIGGLRRVPCSARTPYNI